MYTSPNACRQSWLSPFIQAPYESLQFRAYFHLHAPSIQTYVQYMQMVRLCQLSPLSSSPCTIVSFIIQPINVCKVHAHVQTHRHLHAISLSLFLPPISFPYNIYSAGGQRSLLYIRSASSDSKRHYSHPTTIPCITMRWRGQWKTIMNIGSVKTDWASESLAKVCV